MKNIFSQTFYIPYDDNLIYPTDAIIQEAVRNYCSREGFDYYFSGKDEDDKPLVVIDDVLYEISRVMLRGGYEIQCRKH